MVTVIIPTRNEAENIGALLPAIESALDGAGYPDFEILVMDDDSSDGTPERAIASRVARARVINRRGRPPGLAAAVIEGMREARGDVIAVLDADHSHPPAALPVLLHALESGAMVAVASRYVPGGGSIDWPAKRRLISRSACLLARPWTSVRDATSGFFALRREVVDGVGLEARGFKIGLEVLLKGSHRGRVAEVPYVFRERRLGRSKLRLRHVVAFLLQIARAGQAPASHPVVAPVIAPEDDARVG